jgi:hypothetical protein
MHLDTFRVCLHEKRGTRNHPNEIIKKRTTISNSLVPNLCNPIRKDQNHQDLKAKKYLSLYLHYLERYFGLLTTRHYDMIYKEVIEKDNRLVRAKLYVHLIMLICIFFGINPILADASGNGLLVMQVIKPDLKPMETFTVECFYYDNLNNNRTDASFTSTPVPKDKRISLEFKSDSNFNIIPLTRVNVNGIGSVRKWDITPRREGNYILVLYYSVKGDGIYQLPSKFISVKD